MRSTEDISKRADIRAARVETRLRRWALIGFIVAAALFWLAALYKVSQSILYCVLFHGAINTIGEGIFLGKGTENPLFFLGYILMAAYSIYLWYQRDQQDKA